MLTEMNLMKQVYSEGVYYIPSLDEIVILLGLNLAKYSYDKRRKAVYLGELGLDMMDLKRKSVLFERIKEIEVT